MQRQSQVGLVPRHAGRMGLVANGRLCAPTYTLTSSKAHSRRICLSRKRSRDQCLYGGVLLAASLW